MFAFLGFQGDLLCGGLGMVQNGEWKYDILRADLTEECRSMNLFVKPISTNLVKGLRLTSKSKLFSGSSSSLLVCSV